jgi:hypothetical protein
VWRQGLEVAMKIKGRKEKSGWSGSSWTSVYGAQSCQWCSCQSRRKRKTVR